MPRPGLRIVGTVFLDGAHHLYRIGAVIFVTLFTWVAAIWASCDESDKLHEAEKPDTSADEHHYRNVA